MMFARGFFPSSIPLTGKHSTACKWPLSRCHWNLSRYRTGKYLCLVCFSRFTVSLSLLSFLSESNRKLPNDQHFVFRGRKTACGRKQTSNENLKVLVPWSAALKPEGLKVERHFPQQPTACFLYPLLGPPSSTGCHHWQSTECLYTISAWRLAAFLFSHNGLCFSERI